MHKSLAAEDKYPLVGCGPPPKNSPSLLLRLLSPPANEFEALPRSAYEEPIWEWITVFGKVLVVSDPDAIRHILVERAENYPKSESQTRLLAAAVGNSLVVSEGDQWKSHRRLLAPVFDAKSITNYGSSMMAAANSIAASWSVMGKDAEIDIAEEMAKFSFDVISRALFSGDAADSCDIVLEKLRSSIEEVSFVNLLDALPLLGRWRTARKMKRISRHLAPLDAIASALMRKRESRAHGSGDLIERLMGSPKREAGNGLSDIEIVNEIKTILIAGVDTSALVLTFAWYLVSQHPEVERELHKELQDTLGHRRPHHADLRNLRYTRMVLEETMRLFPPIPSLTFRTAQQDDQIGGTFVRCGTSIAIMPWVLHRHRALWHEPETFNPKRFFSENSISRHRFAYLPFGGGPHVCIGASFAAAEMQLALATLAQRFRLSLCPGQKILLEHRVAMRPRNGIRMIVRPR